MKCNWLKTGSVGKKWTVYLESVNQYLSKPPKQIALANVMQLL